MAGVDCLLWKIRTMKYEGARRAYAALKPVARSAQMVNAR